MERGDNVAHTFSSCFSFVESTRILQVALTLRTESRAEVLPLSSSLRSFECYNRKAYAKGGIETYPAPVHQQWKRSNPNLSSILSLGGEPTMVFCRIPLPLFLHELSKLPFLLKPFVSVEHRNEKGRLEATLDIR